MSIVNLKIKYQNNNNDINYYMPGPVLSKTHLIPRKTL